MHLSLPPVILSLRWTCSLSHCFCSQHLPSLLSPPLGLMAPERIHSCPQSVQPEVLGWAVVAVVALLGEPGPPPPKCPAGRQALSHSGTLPALLSTYALTHTLSLTLCWVFQVIALWFRPVWAWEQVHGACSYSEAILDPSIDTFNSIESLLKTVFQ